MEIVNDTYYIYCDMDGVLADFDKLYTKYSGGVQPSIYRKKYGHEAFWATIEDAGEKFWSSMEWMPDGKKLYNYIKPYDPILLSSFPKIPSRNLAVSGKIKWINKHLDTKNYEFVKKQDKKLFSQKNRILIDDNANTIKEWNSKGGIGILHTNANATIKKLKELGL